MNDAIGITGINLVGVDNLRLLINGFFRVVAKEINKYVACC